MPAIPVLGRQRQEGSGFNTTQGRRESSTPILGYIVRPIHKKTREMGQQDGPVGKGSCH